VEQLVPKNGTGAVMHISWISQYPAISPCPTSVVPECCGRGEQQRVAIARALINKPNILFADEPTANLDRVSSMQILELFRALNQDMWQTILMMTHKLEDADIGTRVIWLADGEVLSNPWI